MSAGIGAIRGPVASATDTTSETKLRRSAQQLEGVFVEQLFKAMRETVPGKGGLVDRGEGEEMFSGMLDAHVAAEAPAKWHSGLGEALFRQLRAALPAEQRTATAAVTQTEKKR